MTSGFSNPILGGTALIRENIHSPDYAAGSTGWTINKDGTAEFNGVTVRGTIILGNGTTNTIILDETRSAIFVYDSSGALVGSIAPSPGTDSLGNAYAGGVVGYGLAGSWAALESGQLVLNNTDTSGVPSDFNILANNHGGAHSDQPFAQIFSPTQNGFPTPVTAILELFGQDAAGLRSAFARMRAGGGAPLDLLVQGTVRYSFPGPNNFAETWHFVNASGGAAPAFNAGWSNTGAPFGNVAYTHGNEDNVKLSGVCSFTGSAAAPQTIFQLPVGYRPNRDTPRGVTAIGSDGAVQAQEVLVIRAATGNVQLTSWTGTGIITPVSLEGVEFPLTVA